MPPPGWKTVSIRNKILEGLRSMFNEDKNKPSNQEFGAWLDEMLSKTIEHHNLQKKLGVIMKMIHMFDRKDEETEIMIYDYLRKQSIMLLLDKTEKILFCTEDERSDCMHVGFSLGLPEVYSLLGGKPESKRDRFAIARAEDDMYAARDRKEKNTEVLLREQYNARMEIVNEQEKMRNLIPNRRDREEKEKMKRLMPNYKDNKEKEKTKPVST